MNTIYAKDYRIVPGTMECQTANIAEMIEQNPADTCFIFEPGEYHFYPENALERSFTVSNSTQTDMLKIAILMEDMRNIVFDGQGSEFIYHGIMTPLVITECEHVEVKNIAFDSAIPQSAEAKVLSVQENEIEVYVDHNLFPYRIEDETLIFAHGCGQEAPLYAGMTGMEFDPETGRIPTQMGDTFPRVKVSEVKEDILCMKGDFEVLPKVGNIIVLRHGERIHPGALVQYSKDTVLENITYHQTSGLGVVFQFNENITVSNVRFWANTKKGVQITSGHDDALHFSHNKGAIKVDHCAFSGLMDDPINVHGIAARVIEKVDENVLRCAFCHPQSINFPKWAEKGDEVGFINHLNRQCYDKRIVSEYKLLSPTEFEIRFESAVPEKLVCGHAIENLTWTPSLDCRNSYFGSCRARGLLVTTPGKVVIEDNVFESSGSAITITGDMRYWYESGTCSDVLIHGNKFVDCCTTTNYEFSRAAIHIEPCVESDQDAVVHHNIRILDNEFFVTNTGVLFADHAGEIVMEGNKIFAKNHENVEMMTLMNCDDITTQNNTLKVGSYERKDFL